jgi:hypothetical protein
MTFYEHLPDAIRETVDEIVEVLRSEPWQDRFAMLYGLLCDKIEERVPTILSLGTCFKSGAASSRRYWSSSLPIARSPNAWH